MFKLAGKYGTGSGSNIFTSSNSAASDATAGISTVFNIRSNMSDMLKSHASTSKTFYGEFDATMDDLKSSADKVSKIDFSKLSKADLTETTDAEGKTAYKRSEALTKAVDSVKSLVSDYNDSIKFFQDNNSVSKRVGNLATTFGDTTYRSGGLSAIGIKVESDGQMTVDEDKLTKALTENQIMAEAVLGKDGLAGKADRHVDFANSQRDKLFPSAKSMLGGEMTVTGLYTGKTLQNIRMRC
jgi:hypothetical protein